MCVGVGNGSHIGAQIIANGGNAVDAMVASAFMNSIYGSAFGFFGGAGFITIYDRYHKQSYCIDCRESLSQDVIPDMEWPGKSKESYSTMNTGVPGFLAGLYLMFKNHASGNYSWSELLQPAIDYLQINQDENIPLLDTLIVDNFKKNGQLIDSSKYANQFFSNDIELNNLVSSPEFKLKQEKKLNLFKKIQEYGIDYFYKGKETLWLSEDTFADRFAQGIQNQLNLNHIGDEEAIRPYVPKLKDMEAYEAKYRNPTYTHFRFNGDNYEVIAHPSPCSAHCASFCIKLAAQSKAVINHNMKHPGTIYRMGMVSEIAYRMRAFIACDYDNWINTPVVKNFEEDMKSRYNLSFSIQDKIKSNDDFYNFLVADETISIFANFLVSQPDWISVG